jgi:hypothetical protein
MSRRSTIDVTDLLSIDVESELLKLSQAQLEGPWQLPAELVRREIRDGATNIDVHFQRGRVLVSSDVGRVDRRVLEALAILLDSRRSNADRHAALGVLERAGEVALIAMAGVGISCFEVSIDDSVRRHRLTFAGGTAPILAEGPSRGSGSVIVLESPAIERRRAARWLAEAARFARPTVRIQGKALRSSLRDALVVGPLQPPLSGQIWIPSDGIDAHAWLLEHGLVTARMSIPSVPCFCAAVELGGSSQELSAARARERMQPNLPILIGQGVTLIERLARGSFGCEAPRGLFGFGGVPRPGGGFGPTGASARLRRAVLGDGSPFSPVRHAPSSRRPGECRRSAQAARGAARSVAHRLVPRPRSRALRSAEFTRFDDR